MQLESSTKNTSGITGDAVTSDQLLSVFQRLASVSGEFKEVWDGLIPTSSHKCEIVRIRDDPEDPQPISYVKIRLKDVRSICERFPFPEGDLMESFSDWKEILECRAEKPLKSRIEPPVDTLLHVTDFRDRDCVGMSLLTQILLETRSPSVRSFVCKGMAYDNHEEEVEHHMFIVAELRPHRWFVVDPALQDQPIEISKIKTSPKGPQVEGEIDLRTSRILLRDNPSEFGYSILWNDP